MASREYKSLLYIAILKWTKSTLLILLGFGLLRLLNRDVGDSCRISPTHYDSIPEINI